MTKPMLEALYGRETSRHPVWFFRQAGRYLPEFQTIRAETDFLGVCRNPVKAAEVTIQPLRRFDLDAAIIFSDILFPLSVTGQHLTYTAGRGPVLTPAIRSEADFAILKMPQFLFALECVGEAIERVKARLHPHQTMVGFAGAPFTVASYMVEGEGSRQYTEIKRLAFREPRLLTRILDFLVTLTAQYIEIQVKAGAEVIVLFDSWAGNLSPQDYQLWALPPLRRLLDAIRCHGVPVVYYPGSNSEVLLQLGGLDLQGLAVDWRTSLRHADRLLRDAGQSCHLQGNLDPQILMGDRELIRSRVRHILDEAALLHPRRHIFNVGHGLLPHIPIQGVEWAVEAVRQWKAPGV